MSRCRNELKILVQQKINSVLCVQIVCEKYHLLSMEILLHTDKSRCPHAPLAKKWEGGGGGGTCSSAPLSWFLYAYGEGEGGWLKAVTIVIVFFFPCRYTKLEFFAQHKSDTSYSSS